MERWNRSKALCPEHPGGRRPWHLLQLFKHCFRQTAWSRQYLGGNLESVFTDVRRNGEAEGWSMALLDSKAQSRWRNPAHHSLSDGLSATYWHGRTVSHWCIQSVPKPAAAARAPPLLGVLLMKLSSLSLQLFLQGKIWNEWAKFLIFIIFTVDISLKGNGFRGGKVLNMSFLRIWGLLLLPHSQNPLVFLYRTILHLIQMSQIIPMK